MKRPNDVTVFQGDSVTCLSQRQYDVLRSLDRAWVRPMDVGGTDGSHHSDTLAVLVRKGFARRRGVKVHCRASYRYRITPKGERAIGRQ